MANIQEDINQIATARYGRDVRSSIVDALTLMNVESAAAYDKAETSQESARAYAEECEGYASRLENFDGGSTNQVLTKNSDADFDYSWKDSQGGSGGTSAIDVTQAEYDAHATEYAQTDSFYQISDADDTLSADDVAYGDNSTVGAKLDSIDNLMSKDNFYMKDGTCNLTTTDSEIDRYTPTSSGIYLVNLFIDMPSANVGHARISKNSGTYATNRGYGERTVSATIKIDSGDYISFRGLSSTSTNSRAYKYTVVKLPLA